MLTVLPKRWRRTGACGDAVARPEGGDACDSIRSALEDGERLFLLCAEGAAREAGWLAASDHISLFGRSPLRGPNRDDLGPRFPSLKGIYACPPGSWRSGVVLRVSDWRLATPAELEAAGADAAADAAVDEAAVAGHGGGRVMLLVRCHPWGGTFDGEPPLTEAAGALGARPNGLSGGGAGAPPERRGR
jgi:hypothetical protein